MSTWSSHKQDHAVTVVEPAVTGDAPIKVKTTPLPKLKILACCATFLSEAMCCCVLLPFVGLYVAHLKGISVESAGYFSGVLVGLFMLGQVLSSKLWGWVSDVYGRKVPLIIGLVAGAFAMLFFGVSPNIYLCCLMRFLHGVFNGNVLIAKIIVSDVTDATNAALGFSTIGLLWCVGAVVGPAIGGLLYDPLNNPQLQWLHVQPGSFLARYPAFLPSLFLFLYAMATFVLCMMVLPETNKNRTKSLRNVPIIGLFLNYFRPKKVTIVDEVEHYPLGEGENSRGGSRWKKSTSRRGSRASSQRLPPSCPATRAPRASPMTYKQALADTVIRNITILYMCVSAGDIFFNEVLPLWAISSTESGGLGMFSDEVGVLMLLFSIPTFLANIFFARVYKAMHSANRMWTIGGAINIVAVILIPYASNFTGWTCFLYIFVLGSIKNCAGSTLFNIIHLHTAKAAPPGMAGSVYGISQSFSYSVRTVVPFLAAPAYAWSVSGQHVFPFNHYFTFIVFMLPMVIGVCVTMVGRIERTEEEIHAWREVVIEDVEKTEEGDAKHDGERDEIEDGSTFSSFRLAQDDKKEKHNPNTIYDGDRTSHHNGNQTRSMGRRDGEGSTGEGGIRDAAATLTPLWHPDILTKEEGNVQDCDGAIPGASPRAHPSSPSFRYAHERHLHYHYGSHHSCPHSTHTIQGLPVETFSSLLDDRSLAASFAMSTCDAHQLMEPTDPYMQFQQEYAESRRSEVYDSASDEEDENHRCDPTFELDDDDMDNISTAHFHGRDAYGKNSRTLHGKNYLPFHHGAGAGISEGAVLENREEREGSDAGWRERRAPRTPASRLPPLQRGWLAKREEEVQREDARLEVDFEEVVEEE